MNNNWNVTIGEIVADNYRTASVFSKYGIDFCCKGDRTLEQACDKKSINIQELTNKLNEAVTVQDENINFKSWPLDLLADYIEKIHHSYIREKSPSLLKFLNKVQKVHGFRHPELVEVYNLFSESVTMLEAHLLKEERILFPFIRQMNAAKNNNLPFETSHFGTVENPIEMMKHDHDIEGERFKRISELTQNYTPPMEACNTYRVSFAMLDEFEQNLHKHIHLENNILFPRAIKMESSMK
ncbi:regulator of cell morphogenesis and NO signaling [Apibacter mensalis]|uniref:Regulator of cell morphogenesis and NO signaling n=1 Tax=Apibacter mensalis TaxID=1586267 RepID=A0A0X3ARU6_9FLAO|nr:iron-sulfur cluster repair di-iron protein [Apibacter mensalis]CVK17054.1 regulator of cell morphogenesis and NO signaling [Apibacter mensalis]